MIKALKYLWRAEYLDHADVSQPVVKQKIRIPVCFEMFLFRN